MTTPFKLFARPFPGNVPHVPFLAPWWGVPFEDPASLNCGQYRAWSLSRPAHYQLVDQARGADVFILSIPWKAVRTNPAARAFADEQIREAAAYGAQIVIFFDSDHDDPVAWPDHAIVLRFSIYADARHPREFAIPPFSQDLLPSGRPLQVREKSGTPSVSFCGYAPPLGCRRNHRAIREVARYAAYRTTGLDRRRAWIAHAPRVRAILKLKNSPGLKTSFLLRDSFAFNQWGVLQPGGTTSNANRQRAEFVENLANSDYSLAARGLANCSIRFSEALSLGRTPLFVNTHCVLPYDWIVDWKSVCVWVEEADIAEIGKILCERHLEIPAVEFEARQAKARAMYQQWLSPEGYFNELYRHFSPLAAR
jgi:hypothetical protein